MKYDISIKFGVEVSGADSCNDNYSLTSGWRRCILVLPVHKSWKYSQRDQVIRTKAVSSDAAKWNICSDPVTAITQSESILELHVPAFSEY